MKNNLKTNSFSNYPNYFKIEEFKEGDHFGSISFFTKFKRNFTVKCLDFTTFLTLNRFEFIEMLKAFPEDYERFSEINNRVSFSK